MKNLKILISSSFALFLALSIAFSAIGIVDAASTRDAVDDGGSGTVQSRTVYDYPPEHGEMYFVFQSRARVYPSSISVVSQNYTSNLVVSSVNYRVSGRTHICSYTGMAPNWTNISRSVYAYY